MMKSVINFITSICLIQFLAFSSVATEKPLKPAGYAGFAYREIKSADLESLKLMDRTGIMITKVLPDSPAQKAGFKPGDILMKYDQNDILDVSRFITITRSYHAGDKINVALLREGKNIHRELELVPFPKETMDNLAIEYTAFPSRGINLRAVIVSPPGSENKKLPALLIVSALNSPRLIGVPSYDMFRNTAYAAARRGFRALRFELSGYGDSEGPDYRTQDLDMEINDNLAALDYLVHRSDIDNKKVFIFGHSTGGQIAAILAGRRDTAGLITSSTIGRTMYERSLETLRMQNQLSGESAATIDKKLKEFTEFLVSISRGEPLASIIARNPDIARFVNKDNRIMDDRTPEYWKQQLSLNLSEIYGKIKSPVLIIHGKSDFLTMTACHEHIRDVLKDSGNRDVAFADIPGLDHRYAFAADMKESFENYKTSNFKENPAAVKTITDWLAEHEHAKHHY